MSEKPTRNLEQKKYWKKINDCNNTLLHWKSSRKNIILSCMEKVFMYFSFLDWITSSFSHKMIFFGDYACAVVMNTLTRKWTWYLYYVIIMVMPPSWFDFFFIFFFVTNFVDFLSEFMQFAQHFWKVSCDAGCFLRLPIQKLFRIQKFEEIWWTSNPLKYYQHFLNQSTKKAHKRYCFMFLKLTRYSKDYLILTAF